MFPIQGGQPSSKTYVDDVFSTYLYTGNGSTQTITNGIDLAGKGGMVWVKDRAGATDCGHILADTAQGISSKALGSHSTAAAENANASMSSASNGFSVSQWGFLLNGDRNINGRSYTSWTFRRAAKFFDVVTFTYSQLAFVNHSLGSTPAVVILKRTDAAGEWFVYHTGLGAVTTGTTPYLWLQSSIAQTSASWLYSLSSTSMQFSGIVAGNYVAYLFAHDTSTDGLIQCGSYTGNGSATGPSVSLGWEPQWVMVKRATGGTGNWNIFDSMRGLTVSGQNDAYLEANTTDAEATADWIAPTATGFQITSTSTEVNNNTYTYVYVAIRRSNKPPTTGTQVFIPIAGGFSGSNDTGPANAWDFGIARDRDAATTSSFYVADRLRGIGASVTLNSNLLSTNSTAAESLGTQLTKAAAERGWTGTGGTDIAWLFKRASGFFDVVCYTGDGSTSAERTLSHNLGAAPEFIATKALSTTGAWFCIVKVGSQWAITNAGNFGFSSSLEAFLSSNARTMTATVFGCNNYGADFNSTNASGVRYVSYLFASLPGISKVGTYTGNGGTVNTNGTSQTINCGFTAGARFVLIKRTDNTGDWYVFDTARGLIAANDPYLLMNSTAAEVTTVDAVDPDNSGFIVNQTSGTNLNVTSATYIFLAIA